MIAGLFEKINIASYVLFSNKFFNCLKGWKDEFMTWSPSENGNVSFLTVSTDELWNPGIS